jgi:hypothetical protein
MDLIFCISSIEISSFLEEGGTALNPSMTFDKKLMLSLRRRINLLLYDFFG